MGLITTVVPASPPFRYRTPAQRADQSHGIDWAYRHVDHNFRGWDRAYTIAAIAAKGVMQRNHREPVRIFASGQSGASKTMGLHLAAEIALGTVGVLKFQADLARMAQGVAERAAANDYVLFDEVAKAGCKPSAIAEFLLSMHTGASFWALYRGTKSIVNPGVLVWADTTVPEVFRNNVQVARRVVHVSLGAGVNATGVDWRQTCNTGDVRGWRASRLFPENADACDMILSEVLDAFFTEPRTFEDIAAELGFYTFAKECGDGADPNADLRDLFDAVCSAPKAPGHWKGRGWKAFDPTTETPLAKAWRACVTGEDVQRVSGCKWGELIGAPGVELDISPHGKQIGLRFRLGDPRAANTLFNDEIRPAEPSIGATGESRHAGTSVAPEVAPSVL